jgi:hypothetical protein
MRKSAVLWFFCGLLLMVQADARAQDQYQVRYDDALETISVKACFSSKPPTRLYHNAEASRFSSPITTAGRSFRLKPGADSIRTPALKPGACLHWEVKLGAAVARQENRFAMRAGPDIVSDGDLWFWRATGDRSIRVQVDLPPGFNISVPWRKIGETEQGNGRQISTFEPIKTNAQWTSRIAIGKFENQEIKLGGSTIGLAILGALGKDKRLKLTQWISESSQAVATVYGQFPQSNPQLLLIPIGPRSNPVPWAHVMRGGGVAAEFSVDETRSLNDLHSDWTACHELSHMLLPFVSSKDRWLSEGLASYYQYILLARSGKLTEREAWQGMFDGIKRGENGTDRKNTLAEATLEGWQHTMQVYWSGAAMMLKADVSLRASSGNQKSLDTTLAALQSCCMDKDKRWRASELFKRMDALSDTNIFSRLFDEHVNSKYFPDLDATWESLGLIAISNEISLSGTARLSRVREAIMRK